MKIITYWYIIAPLTFIFGFLVFPLISRIYKLIRGWLKGKAPDIQKYWKFVGLFFLVFTPIYIISYIFAESDLKFLLINQLNYLSGLVFAIAAGYFAFTQVNLMRTDKLFKEGFEYIKALRFDKAIRVYQELTSINPHDFGNYATLLELFIIEKRWDEFDEKYNTLKKTIFNCEDELIYSYLQSAYYLSKEHLQEAKESIIKTISIMKTNKIQANFWDFGDILSSDLLKNHVGDANKLLKNLIHYLNGMMKSEDRNLFEAGNYLLGIEKNLSGTLPERS